MTSAAPRTPPFLPDGSPFRLAAVIFDFDGTLTQPGDIDFAAVHDAVGCPRSTGLLEFLAGIDDEPERRRKELLLEEAEDRAAEKGRANEGAVELVAFLRAHGVPMAVITRNRRQTVEHTLALLDGIDRSDFALVLGRDLGLGPKPLPDGVLHAAAELGVDPGEVLLIGDHSFDVEAGRRAGTLTMYLQNQPPAAQGAAGGAGGAAAAVGSRPAPQADFLVCDLHEARRIIRYGLPLPPGKLPPDLLEETVGAVAPVDASVLVGARLGEDAAAVDVRGAEVLVLASDPITLASDSIARYAVLVNANDVATSGALPRWLLTTLLFPPGSTASQIAALVRDIQENCAPWGISLCGGHTEITDAVSRPLVMGTMAGLAPAGRLLDKRDMRDGDVILLTKRVAVEGTGLIAREYSDRLTAAGMSAAEVAEAAGFLEHLSILDEARVALGFSGVTALHDVTEGGLATALSELGAAGGRRLRVHTDRIPEYPQTEHICRLLGLNPLGLIGSGSLLITCSAEQAKPLAAAVVAAGIEVAEIGRVLGEGRGIEALRGDLPVDWPRFERDEVSRLTH